LQVDARAYLGHTVRVAGELRSRDLLGFARPEAAAIGAGGAQLSTASGNELASSTSDWIPFTMTLSVPAGTTYVEVGTQQEGLGSIDLRNLTIDVSAGRQ
jgi:hypothetical protein